MSMLRVYLSVGLDEISAARIDMHGTIDASNSKAATDYVLPGQKHEFYIHSGMNLRVSQVSVEQATMAMAQKANGK